MSFLRKGACSHQSGKNLVLDKRAPTSSIVEGINAVVTHFPMNDNGDTHGSTFSARLDSAGGYMVAFAGRKYAARSTPAFVANGTYTVTSFTLVFEFQKGRLQNLFWKRDGCASCGSGKSNYVCLNNQDCAIRTSSCKGKGGPVDCSIGIQLAFSGTDKHLRALNSWYEVENLRQYSLYNLYSNLRGSLTDQYNKIF
ncbi:hypothetical protein IFM89_006210 [Coptis chinensis]|uniref:Expp1 protein n=1 Tax=Coptis chinensis TaxID=261450 RepID=A0A835LLJ1_9MAGN|nr:hypothetical protein IFM89_006210 [Coptis chinensis]